MKNPGHLAEPSASAYLVQSIHWVNYKYTEKDPDQEITRKREHI